MKKYRFLLFTILLLILAAGSATAVPVLYDSSLTVNGIPDNYLASDVYKAPEIGSVGGLVTGVTGFGDSGNPFGDPSAFGSVTVTYNPGAAGGYSIFGFFDAEITEGENTYSNEDGAIGGTAGAGQSGSIILDDPDPNRDGADIALEVGWDFSLEADEWAIITFLLSDIAPDPGTYYLLQSDLTSGEMIYLTSTLDIQGGAPVPEPTTMMLLGTGLIGMCAAGRRRLVKK